MTIPRALRSQYTGLVFVGVKDSEWSAEHIAAHGVTMSEVRDVVLERPYWMTSGRNDTTLVYGRTHAGRYLFVVTVDDHGEAFVVTARDMTTGEKRTYQRKAT